MGLGHGPVTHRPFSRSEAGTGLIGTSAGAAVFILLMLFAVQLTVHLYATSTVNAAGYDAARMVAARTVDHSSAAAVGEAQTRAEERFRELVGDGARDATFTWGHDGDDVTLHVVVAGPRILPSTLRDDTGLGDIERTFRVRVERER